MAHGRSSVNEPVVGRWYINVAIPPGERSCRLMCKSVRGNLVNLVDDPREPTREIVWRVDAFRAFFRACEDLSRAHVLGSCAPDCPTCFHPLVTLGAKRAVAFIERQHAKRAALTQQKRTTAATIRRHRARQSAAMTVPIRKAR